MASCAITDIDATSFSAGNKIVYIEHSNFSFQPLCYKIIDKKYHGLTVNKFRNTQGKCFEYIYFSYFLNSQLHITKYAISNDQILL